MAIEMVLYKKENDIEKIYLEEIYLRADLDLVRKNLYCAFPGCTAKMEYVPKGVRIAHFKTWVNNDHTIDCVDYFKREEKRKSRKTQSTTAARLTDKHINNVLKGLMKYADETEEEKQLRLEKQRKKYKEKKSRVNDNSDITEDGVNTIPTTDENAQTIEVGTKAPPVKRRYGVSFLSEDDVGYATGLHENIKTITIEENRVIILLSKNSKKTNVYFEESFFANSSRNIHSMFKVVEEALQKGLLINLDCVGNVERRDGELCLVISAQNHIRLNKQTIEKFTFNYNNPNLL